MDDPVRSRLQSCAFAGACLTLLTVLSVATPTMARAADPFYENAFERGRQSADLGDAASAAEHLRVACFGMLEEPPRLAECLVHLGMAQHAGGDLLAFDATAARLLELERRFGAYSAAALSPTVRSSFEPTLVERATFESLSQLPAFQDAARNRLEIDLQALDPESRRNRLTELVTLEPRRIGWRLLLAREDLAGGRAAVALETLGPILAQQPDHPRARCLAGHAQAALGQCEPAIDALATCGGPESDPAVSEIQIGCMVRIGAFERAEATLATLPPAQRQSKAMKRLARDVRKGSKSRPAAAPVDQTAAVPADGTADGTVDGATDVPTDAARDTVATMGSSMPADDGTTLADGAANTAPPVEPPPPSADDELEALRARLVQATDVAALDIVMQDAEQVAVRHPAHPEVQFLAAEIAYRLRRWPRVVEYARRGGPEIDTRPALLFYLAVALYETGDQEEAATVLRRCLPRLQATDFVQRYTTKILGS